MGFDTNDMGTVVAVGYYVHVNGTSELVLAPELNSTRLWNSEDQIIVLTREKKRKSKVNRRRMSAAGVSTERQSIPSDRSASFEVDSMVLPGTPAASVAVIAPVETDCSSGEPVVADAADNAALSSPVNQQCDSPPCDSPTEASSPISEQSSPVDETSTLDSSKTKKDKKDKKDKKAKKEKKSKDEEAVAAPTVEVQPRVENASEMPPPRLQPADLPALASSPGALG